MNRRSLFAAILAAAALALPASVFAQDAESPGEPAAESTDDAGEAEASASADESEDEETDEEAEEETESEHGSYEWKPSYGGGIELGLWFVGLERWNTHLVDDSLAPIDVSSLWYLDLAAEASVLEGTRFTIFGGMQRPFANDPTVSALYVGFEPAFAFRRDFWELALGIGAGLGSTRLEYDTGETMNAGLVVLRPFLEVRRYLGTVAAVYLRGGFHQWLVNDPQTDGIEFTAAENNLDEGGPYFALGVRFGHYPEHVKDVPDTDGDGMRDDVDECPEEPEDFDGFEDEDGCPDLDNDGDGIPDDEDECPNRPEDMDGWQDEDGCPETDDDTDGDGILNVDDQCPEEPEDFDGFEDEDGCPDPDNDNDGILDKDDKCPDEPGVAAKDGCPYELVQVTLDKIEIKEKIFFEFDKAVIKEESFPLLNQVADTINSFSRIKKIEIQGHTDHKGSEEYNQKLSQSRAESVFNYLTEKGEVDPDRLVFKGYGESKPLVPLGEDGKESKEDAAKNRRVEFHILEQEKVEKTVREDKVDEALKTDDVESMKKVVPSNEKNEESDDDSEETEETEEEPDAPEEDAEEDAEGDSGDGD